MELKVARVAQLIGEPARARMLVALMGQRALTATELADIAEVTGPTASMHLAKMSDVGLLRYLAQGRHRYYLLASAEVARMLEGIMVVAESGRVTSLTTTTPAHMREARTCYDHLAGRVAVAIADALVARAAIRWDADGGEVTPSGEKLFSALGVIVETKKRVYCRPCVDWSERRPHIAGALGAGLLERLLALKWLSRGAGRNVDVTAKGREELKRWLNLGGFELGA